DEGALEQAFDTFASAVGELVVLSADDPATRRLAERRQAASMGARTITFGESADADVRLVEIGETGPVRFRLATGGDEFSA
ncbi:hypothetical protein LAJ57_13910, partial [Streptococcus pneumoniae]|uniref:hypothetical protein n=1 Tax=Streptococcus pneumoniae TaxID=1313 RepID=UPI001CC178ED